jgi:5-methyltetrahydropteroyltriglutamate--homocysteine methyltransferase
MSVRESPPFRADHVGSLLRPQVLLDAREQFGAGAIALQDLRRVEDEAITEIVRTQEEIGLRSATDGEFRRASWHMDFIYQLGGITKGDEHIEVEFRDRDGRIFFSPAALHVSDRVSLDDTIFADAFEYLKGQVTSATPKLTIPSPSMVHYRGGRAAIDPNVYADIDEFWADL